MRKLKKLAKSLIDQKWFEFAIVFVIIINSALIGIETYGITPITSLIQRIALYIFTFEIIARFIARDSIKQFFKSGWNIFDLFLVLVGYIPEDSFEGGSVILVVRILRIFRILRLLRISPEIKLIVAVLSKSLSALLYNGLFFFIFLYLFSVMGISLFKLPTFDSLDEAGKLRYEHLMEIAPHVPACSPDPYGTLPESMFTLFRMLSADDWTDIRYNLIVAHDEGFIKTSPIIITSFHVIWFILSAFLLLNLVVGAIVNNYQIIMEETKKENIG